MQSLLRTISSISYRSQHRCQALLLSSSIIASMGLLLTALPAQAAPARRDWCGVIWSVENTSQLAWVNSSNGVTNTLNGPNAEIPTLPQGGMGSSVAAIGIHKESGTMYAFDRGQAANNQTGAVYRPGVLYKYRFGVDTTWQAVTVSGLIGLGDAQSIAGASNNLNKMTVDKNILLIAESNGVAVYSIPLNSNGNVTGAASSTTYSYSGDPGAYLHISSVNNPTLYPVGTEFINGGDITVDEYGDIYNITYNVVVTGYPVVGGVRQQQTVTTKAYFYKKSGNTWQYQGETAANANFAGAAFYRGDLYVKAAGQLRKVDLTRSGSGYTGWNNPLTNIGSASTTSSADLAACGTPILTINKSRAVYTDAALTNLATDQTKVRTGQYVKYTIAAQNTGDAWARGAVILDNLPSGTVYIPNSAQLNGTSLNLATYPTSGFPVNSPGIGAGIVRYTPDPDTATITFGVQVTATTGSITNQATTTYVDNDNLPSGPVNCNGTLKIDCGNDGPPLNLLGNDPNVLLVKRITAINGSTATVYGDDLAIYHNTNSPYDDNDPEATPFLNQPNPNQPDTIFWPTPTAFLLGGVNGGNVKPQDEVEYTIYFLSTGDAAANKVELCDRIPTNQSFVPTAFNSILPGSGGIGAADRGIVVFKDNTMNSYTNLADGDIARYYPPNEPLPDSCGSGANSNGAIVVNLGTIPNATAPGLPIDSRGYVRFRVRTK
jgi:uncharacterized repeat protein (TIGR01451 family)